MIFVLPPGTIHLCLLSKFPVCSVHLIPAPPTTKHQHHDGQGDEQHFWETFSQKVFFVSVFLQSVSLRVYLQRSCPFLWPRRGDADDKPLNFTHWQNWRTHWPGQKNEVNIYTFLQESVNIFGVFPICECLKNLRKFDIKSVLENVLCQVYSPAVPLLRWKDQQVGSLKRKREGTWSLIQS